LAIAKGLSYERDLNSEITLNDGKASPDTSEQFLLADDLARALNQNDQEVECASADMNGSISLEQQMRCGLQTKRPKPNRAINGRGDCGDR
jgi:hypothetical protein